MRLLVSYFDSPRKRDIVKRLQEKGATIAYWLFIDDVSSETLVGLRKEFPETIFHGGFLLGAGEPAEGIDDKNFAPVDKDILFKLASYEGQILTMMKREDLDNTMPIFKKIYLYHKYVKYWHGVLTHYNIEAVLAMDIPHLSSWFVLYALCKILGIKCVMMRKTPADRYLFIDDVEDYRKLRERSEQYRGKEKKIEDLSPDMRAYYHRQITNSHNAPPFFMKRGFSRTGDFNWRTPGTRSLFAHIKHLTLPKAAYRYLVLYARFLFGLHYIGGLERRRYYGITLKIKAYQWHCMKMRLKERYYTLQHGADFSRKFIYVPLHSQPECTTSPMGGVFVDQILMVDILSASLPEGWIIYVKEHPHQWTGPRMHPGRFDGYYDEMLRGRDNVKFVPVSTSTYELINHAQAVASVGSSACWEAVLRGTPSLVFGYVWYMYCDGMFRVDDVESCKQALTKIQDGYKPNAQEALNYLVAFDEVSFRGFHNKTWKVGLGLGIAEGENTENIAQAFYEELKKDGKNS